MYLFGCIRVAATRHPSGHLVVFVLPLRGIHLVIPAPLYECVSHSVSAQVHLSLYVNRSPLPAWQLYHNHISKYAMYDPTDPAIDQVLEDLVSLPIVKLYQHAGGTQLKLVFYLPNSARVMWKPHR